MVKVCVFPNCKNKQTKKDENSDHFQFHSFPFKRPDVMAKWIEAVDRGKDWKPSRSSRVCSAHFRPECFKLASANGPRKLLLSDAFPTLLTGASSVGEEGSPCRLRLDAPVATPLTKMQALKQRYIAKLKEVKKNNKILKMRISRRDARIKELKTRLVKLGKMYDYETKAKRVGERLDGFAKELLEHSVRNFDTKRTGIRYSATLREFALTLYLHSPRAYLYVRTLLRLLPNPSLIKKWIADFNRPPQEETQVVTEQSLMSGAREVTTTEELVIDDIDSFIVIEDPVDLQSCLGVAASLDTSSDSVPLVVAQHIQVHSTQT